MRKLLITFAMAGALIFPSFVFADEAAEEMAEEEMTEELESVGPNLYGSFRIGVESSNSNINVKDGGSRWGIRGNHEVGGGLTAVYRFETGVDTSADLNGRLSYVGLSGGFGSLTVGKINSAGYNAVGPILDNSWYYGAAGVAGSRLANAVSYAFSNDLMTVQVDASYENPDAVATTDITGGLTAAEQNAIRNANNLQQVEFGLTVNVGEIGKVGLAYVDDKYSLDESGDLTQADGNAVTGASSWQTKTTVAAAQVSVSGLTASIGSARVKYTNTSGDGAAGDGASAVIPDGKTTFFGIRGGLGDTGVGYVLQWRDVKPANTNPWLISLTKGLGDNASLVLEHGNNDTDPNATQVGLVVNF